MNKYKKKFNFQMEDIKNIFKDIFYIKDDGDYFPLFKENSQEFIIKTYIKIYNKIMNQS